MIERKRRCRLCLGAAFALGLSIGASPAGEPNWRLVRLSADGAGGGVASGLHYSVVLAYGQHDAHGPRYGSDYAFAGGVFAAIPADQLFGDGFE